MKQLGIALANYHERFKSFPPEGIWSNLTATQASNFTWIVLLLPDIDQAPLHAQINFNIGIFNQTLPNGQSIRGQNIPMLLCPTSEQFENPPHGFAVTNYAGAEGWDWYDRGQEWYGGVFTLHRACKEKDISDGTSNTIAVGETSSFSFTGSREGGRGRPRAGFGEPVFRSSLVSTGIYKDPALRSDRNLRPLQRCDGGQQPAGQNQDWWGPWAGPYAYKPTYVSHYGINSDWPGASSRHIGGAQFLFADGSVHFISENISVGNPAWDSLGRNGNVWHALHTTRSHPDESSVNGVF
jgi:prepilin-type processing-associated H-X9-DG protein